MRLQKCKLIRICVFFLCSGNLAHILDCEDYVQTADEEAGLDFAADILIDFIKSQSVLFLCILPAF